MTYKEKLMKEHPDCIDPKIPSQCKGCPYDYGYCEEGECADFASCVNHWNSEMADKPTIKDSGERREFDTGAVRDIQEGKGRCDLLPLDVIFHIYDKLGYLTERKTIVFHFINKFIETGDHWWLVDALLSGSAFDDIPTMLLEDSKHFEDGAKKYGEYNWQKGIPTHCYIDSAVRHYLKWLRGDKDEPHDRAFCWNLLCCIWTCQNKPELNDYRKEGIKNAEN